MVKPMPSKRDQFRQGATEKVNELQLRLRGESSQRGMLRVSPDLLEPDPDQPRHDIDSEALGDLTESIRRRGVLQPLLVSPLRNGRYRIVAGERRWRAALAANSEDIPIIIRDDLDSQQTLEVQIEENLYRENLNPIERTLSILRLVELRTGWTRAESEAYFSRRNRVGFDEINELADEVLTQYNVTLNSFYVFHMRLLRLDHDLTELVKEQKLSHSAAVIIGGIQDPVIRKAILDEALASELSRRQIQKRIQALTAKVTRQRQQNSVKVIQRDLTGIKKQLHDASPNLQSWVADQIKQIREALKNNSIPTQE
jgi:ParB family transcriptional regulator, chromosome partitioning protein